MRGRLWGVVAASALAGLASGRAEAVDLAVGARVGTLGVGFDLTSRVTNSLNVRASFHPFPSYTVSSDASDVSYDLKLKMNTLGGLADLHPGGGGFRVTGGVIFNKNEITATAQPTDTFDIGDHSYTPAQVGTLTGAIDFKHAAPYLGLGWGNAVSDKKLGVVFDLGVLFQGSPRVHLGATGSIASNPTFQHDLALEETNMQDDLTPVKYYPMISVGITYKF